VEEYTKSGFLKVWYAYHQRYAVQWFTEVKQTEKILQKCSYVDKLSKLFFI